MKRTFSRVAVVLVCLFLAGVVPAYAATVGGVVDPISALSSETFQSDATGGTSMDAGDTDIVIASAVIDNNYEDGWKLTVTSTNNGVLIRSSAAGGDGTTTEDTVTYTNVKLVTTGGTLGTDLTSPSGTSKDITSGTCIFDTGTASTATTATVAYAFDLKIDVSADTTLLQGTYTDTISMTLAVDDD